MSTVTVNSQEPGRLDLVIPRDRDYALDLAFEDDAGNPIDVSGDSFSADVRRDPHDDSVEFSFSVDNSGFETSNEIQLALEPADTADADPAPHVWDLKQTMSGGDEVSLLRGTIYLTAEVTD